MRLPVPVVVLSVAALAAGAAMAAGPTGAETGKDIAFDPLRGNCLACHAMPTQADAEQAGNSGPALLAMSARFPDKKALRALIWDAGAANPGTMMPPFGKHKVLTEEQIDKVVEYIYGL